MAPVSGFRFLRHPRPETAKVSLRYIFGLGDRRVPIVKSDREQRGPREASIQRHRYPQPTDPVSGRRTLGPVPDGSGRLSVRQGFCSFAREAWPLARTYVCHVFSLQGCLARDLARPLDGVIGPQDCKPRSPCRNGGGETFFPWACHPASAGSPAAPIPREARKSRRRHPPLCSGPKGCGRRSPAAFRSPSRPRCRGLEQPRRNDMATIGSFKKSGNEFRARSAPSPSRPKASASFRRPAGPATTRQATGSSSAAQRSAPPGRSAPMRAAITSRSSSTIRASPRRSTPTSSMTRAARPSALCGADLLSVTEVPRAAPARGGPKPAVEPDFSPGKPARSRSCCGLIVRKSTCPQ